MFNQEDFYEIDREYSVKKFYRLWSVAIDFLPYLGCQTIFLDKENIISVCYQILCFFFIAKIKNCLRFAYIFFYMQNNNLLKVLSLAKKTF